MTYDVNEICNRIGWPAFVAGEDDGGFCIRGNGQLTYEQNRFIMWSVYSDLSPAERERVIEFLKEIK